MTILALDTSHPIGAVTLRTGDRDETVEFGSEGNHLVEMGRAVEGLVQGLLGQSLTGKSHLGAAGGIERIAVVSGPGSFTGLRIGMAYAKGLHAAIGADIVTVSSLELLATRALTEVDAVCVMIDARRSEIYGGVFERDGIVMEDGELTIFRAAARTTPVAQDPRAFLLSLEPRPVVCVGSGAERFRGVVEDVSGTAARILAERPSTSLLAKLAPSLTPADVNALEPFYLRPSDAKPRPLRKVQTHE